MTSTVEYQGQLRTVCTHLQSNSSLETDAPIDNQGKGERFSPTDLLATSLAACMITVMGIKANSMKIELKDVKIEVLKIMKADPRRVSGIELKFNIPTSLQQIESKSKIILKNTGETCPVIKSIHPDIEVKIDWGHWA